MFERYPDLELRLHLAHFPQVALPDSNEKGFAEKLYLEKLDIIYVVGLSQGQPFLALKEWIEAKSGRHLIFLEDDLQALHQLRSFAWAEKMVQHPQVHLRFLKSHEDVLEECAREFPSERIAVVTMKKKTKRFHAIKLDLLRKTVLWNALTSEMLSGHLLHRNIFSNFQKLPRSFYVNRTRDAFKGTPALICGAGPSLNEAAPYLKEIRDHVVLVGCGSALSALSHLNIRPHFGMAIDPNPREQECLKGCKFRDIPLIYGNRLYPGVFELFDGPYGYLRSPTGSPLEKAIEEELGLTDIDIGLDLGREALSVTTLALALACFWGCSPIILAGVDLAYLGKHHYAKGVPLALTRKLQETSAGEQVVHRKNRVGKKIATLVKWIMEQQTIDAYTPLYPHVQFIQAPSQGLGFSSIPPHEWDEIQQLVKDKPSADVEKMIATHATGVSQEKLEQTVSKIEKSFLNCLNLAHQLQAEAEGSGKAILYEEDLKQQIAYQLALRPALEALEKVYKLNLEIPFSTSKWKFLQEITEEYVKVFNSADTAATCCVASAH